ncbi:MAG: hypothetical protein OEW31_06010 [Thermoleophilia bacterium]|nr:hypothetical protein [Thermoleophilia bacterium]MDH4345869.1 hypothetical protein [Thermoleophilia bacterium]
MGKMLYSITWEGAPPSLDEVCARFGFGGDEVDREFGVVATDPDAHLYAVLVEEAAVERLLGEAPGASESIEGPFANPLIEPFDLRPGGDE